MSKKFILFIVEGKNDRSEIEAILHTPYYKGFYEKYIPHFMETNGDITTDTRMDAKKILQRLNDIILDFRRNGVPFSNIKVQDIQRVIHVVDTDGVFIPEECIRQAEVDEFQYQEDEIVTYNVSAAIGRNRRKAEVLRRLVATTQIGNIPYSVYFASCNMDHLLFDKRMSNQREKRENAVRFQRQCSINPECLNQIFFNQSIVATGFQMSWEIIQEGCQSLQRKTNINLFLNETGGKEE